MAPKITVDFNGGNQSSNAGLLLLREAERKRGVCQRLAAAIPDHRDPDRGRDTGHLIWCGLVSGSRKPCAGLP